MSMNASLARNRDRVNLVEPGRLHPAVSFARASTATYMGSDGLLKTAAVDEPRHEYDAAGNYLGLLIEGANTNLLVNANWAGSISTPTGWASGAVAGGSRTRLASILSSASGEWAYQFVSSTAGDRNLLTSTDVAVSPGDVVWTSVYLEAVTGLPRVDSVINATTQPAGTTVKYYQDGIQIVASQIVAVGRLSAAFTITTSGALKMRYGMGVSTGAVVGSVTMSHPQAELSQVTSWISTSTTTVTRSADVAQATSLSTLGINTTAGTFVIQHDAPTGAPLIYSGSNKILDSAGGTKVAIAYDASGTRTSVNGAATTTGAALTWSTTLDLLRSATAGANAHVKSLTWYNTKRAASELQRLTA